MEKLKVQPVMLPTNQKSKLVLVDKMLYLAEAEAHNNTEIKHFNQHLYFIDPAKIDNVPIGTLVWNDEDYSIYKTETKTPDNYYHSDHIFPIIASTDASLKLPLIPKTFIAKFAESQGSIKFVWIELED